MSCTKHNIVQMSEETYCMVIREALYGIPSPEDHFETLCRRDMICEDWFYEPKIDNSTYTWNVKPEYCKSYKLVRPAIQGYFNRLIIQEELDYAWA